MSQRRRDASRRPLALVGGLAILACLSLSGCDGDETASPTAGATPTGSPTTTPDAEPSAQPVRVHANASGRDVPVSTRLALRAEDGTLRRIEVTSDTGPLPGVLSADGTRWRATELLEPGTRYAVTGQALDGAGAARPVRRGFTTESLTLAQQTYASIAPVEGETVGVGMPVIVSFDIPVTDRAAVERRLSVTSRPAQAGSWHWLSDREVHWRPREYWQAGTDVTVRADINGVSVGGGIFGQEDREIHFRIGSRLIMHVDVAAHRMDVRRNGELLRTIPVSAGKAGFTTRSGVKVIIEKFRRKRMDAATTGIDENDPEYYNLDNVEFAQRVTYSGEFLHAAPWSVGSQGQANVSHGCVGMSTADAAWLYALTSRGDVVDVVGTDRPMEPTNGFGDWNLDWQAYQAGSALS